jgi:hypothetical protein
MAETGSMLRHRLTSPGKPAVDSTFVDETSHSTMRGEIAEVKDAALDCVPLVREVEVGQAR